MTNYAKIIRQLDELTKIVRRLKKNKDFRGYLIGWIEKADGSYEIYLTP